MSKTFVEKLFARNGGQRNEGQCAERDMKTDYSFEVGTKADLNWEYPCNAISADQGPYTLAHYQAQHCTVHQMDYLGSNSIEATYFQSTSNRSAARKIERENCIRKYLRSDLGDMPSKEYKDLSRRSILP